MRPRRPTSPIATLAFVAVTLGACSTDPLTSPSETGDPDTSSPVGIVGDLAVLTITLSSVTLSWTDVSDGAGGPATYRVKYATPFLEWNTAGNGCAVEIVGVQVGSRITCTVEGLRSGTRYEFQLMSYRDSNGAVDGPQYSNVAYAMTATPLSELPEQATTGIWISPSEVVRLPMSGPAWENLLTVAGRPCGAVNLADQEQSTNVCMLAKALVFVRTGVSSYRDDVIGAITQIVDGPTYEGRALALGRELGAYVVAADLIALRLFDPALDEAFRVRLRALRTAYTSGAAANLIACHERRPNNWGAHCGATRAAIAVYLHDDEDLARTAKVFKGYLGDRAAYAGFEFDGPAADLTWQCDPDRPVGINPASCVRGSAMLDGVLPDDQRRAGSYRWPAPQENYVWEALQGLLAQAVILDRAGYRVWEWEDRALLRATRWLHDVNSFPATGDDTWLPFIVNRHYGTSFPVPSRTIAGKNFGFTDWTHHP